MWHYSGALLYERPWNKQEELWEVAWQNFPQGTFKTPMVNYKPVEGIVPTQPQASKEVYRPPVARGLAVSFKLHEDEGTPQVQQSKTAIKLKKKREAKKAAKAAQAVTDNGTVESSSGTSNGLKASLEEFTTDDPVKMKKIGRIRSKLMEIERLKEQQKIGRQLEINQLEKIKKEDQLLKELRELAL